MGEGSGRAVRVLVVDDDPDSLVTLSLLLRGEGYEVRMLRRGAEVPRVVAEFNPDAVLLDIGMPDRGGHELAQELVERYGAKCPVLIALTAHASDADREMAEISGFHYFLPKPYDPGRLLRLLGILKRSG